MVDGASVWFPRRWGVVGGVLLLHALVLWWLQSGLIRDVMPLVTPVTLIGSLQDQQVPRAQPPAESAPRPIPLPRQVPAPERPAISAPIASSLPTQPVSPSAPSQSAPMVSAPESAPAASAGGAPPAAGARSPLPSAAGGGSNVVLPSAQAAYLHNPPPAYPAMSRRLAEQGRVMVRVFIGADGLPQKAELQTGSGYDRLDRAALDSVMRWRFVPGRRGDVPEAMWVSVPIVFNLE